MCKEFELYFCDLNDDTQRRFLKFEGLETASDGNYDTFPIAVIPLEVEDDES